MPRKAGNPGSEAVPSSVAGYLGFLGVTPDFDVWGYRRWLAESVGWSLPQLRYTRGLDRPQLKRICPFAA